MYTVLKVRPCTFEKSGTNSSDTTLNSKLPGSVSLHLNCQFLRLLNSNLANRISFIPKEGNFRYLQNVYEKSQAAISNSSG